MASFKLSHIFLLNKKAHLILA